MDGERDSTQQRFVWELLLFSTYYLWFWCSGVWPKKIVLVIENCSKKTWTILYMCKITIYNTISELWALIPLCTYFWTDWNIWFCRACFSVLVPIILKPFTNHLCESCSGYGIWLSWWTNNWNGPSRFHAFSTQYRCYSHYWLQCPRYVVLCPVVNWPLFLF